jgi:RNA polymerase sigma-70 factor (ECF subfamily)
MSTMPDINDAATRDLLAKLAAGDQDGWAQLVSLHHARLRRMVAIRLDFRLHGRVDPSDVLQEAYLHAARVLPAYLRAPEVPFFVWLRRVAGDRLARIHREHLGAKMRAAGRELSLDHGPPIASSEAMAARLLGRSPRPSEEAVRAEFVRRVQDVLNDMEPTDREVLALRHFEQLTRKEAAMALNISEAAVAKRHMRALAKLKAILDQYPGGLEGLRP